VISLQKIKFSLL